MSRQFVAYYRVSTDRQSHSGLGLEAQRAAVRRYLDTQGAELLDELTEVESGTRNDRPELNQALRLCRIRGAALVIARLDRLARNVSIVSRLMDSGVEFVAADFPQANRLTIHILAAIAEYESKLISERTKAALALVKARGVKLGGDRGKARLTQPLATAASIAARMARARARARDLAPIILPLKACGATLRAIAEELTRQRIQTPRRLGKWHESAVRRLLAFAVADERLASSGSAWAANRVPAYS